jgi:Na+/proline symporter
MSFLHHGNSIPDVVAFVGFLVFCAGLHLLWLSRADLFAWLQEFIRLFRLSVRQVMDPVHTPLEMVGERLQRRHTARIVLGVLLAFFLAPMLITLGLGF